MQLLKSKRLECYIAKRMRPYLLKLWCNIRFFLSNKDSYTANLRGLQLTLDFQPDHIVFELVYVVFRF